MIFYKNKLFKLLTITNLTKAEWIEVDIEGCMVLMNKLHYKKKKISQQLNDANTYQKIDQKCDNHTTKKQVNWQTNVSHSLKKRRSYISQTFIFQEVIDYQSMDYRRFVNVKK